METANCNTFHPLRGAVDADGAASSKMPACPFLIFYLHNRFFLLIIPAGRPINRGSHAPESEKSK